jgi:hypothetical protein
MNPMSSALGLLATFYQMLNLFESTADHITVGYQHLHAEFRNFVISYKTRIALNPKPPTLDYEWENVNLWEILTSES